MVYFKNTFFLVIGFIILASCEPSISFTDPQPINTENVFEFPKRYRGRYFSSDGNSILVVGNNFLTRINEFDVETLLKDIDNNWVFEGSFIVDKELDKMYSYKKNGDTLIVHHRDEDTFFEFDSEHVVRKLKGFYFLNTNIISGVWEVQKLDFGQNEVNFCSISTVFDFEDLKEVTNTSKEQVLPFKFSPTSKQFKKFVRKNGFKKCELYTRKRFIIK